MRVLILLWAVGEMMLQLGDPSLERLDATRNSSAVKRGVTVAI